MLKQLVMTGALLTACSPVQVEKPLTPLEHAQRAREEGRLTDAEQEFKVLADRGDAKAELELAETLILRGHHAEAAQILKPRLANNLQDAQAAGLLARAYDGMGRIDDAISAYARRLTLIPGDVAAAARMTELLLARGDPEHAGQVAQAGLKLTPQEPKLTMLAGRAMLARGRLPVALELSKRAVELAPQDADAWLLRGQVLMMAGELADAEVALTTATRLVPESVPAQSELVSLWLENGNVPKALKLAQQLTQKHQTDAALWNQLASARHRSGDQDGAVAALDQAIQLEPRRSVLQRNLAEVALEAGWPDRALHAAVEARTLLKARTEDSAHLPEADNLVVRAVVAQVMTQRACKKAASAGIEAELKAAVAKYGVAATAEELTAAANREEDAIRAAVARCRAANPAGAP